MADPGGRREGRDAAHRELERALAAARGLELAPEHRASYVRDLRTHVIPATTRRPHATRLAFAWAMAASIACAVLALRSEAPSVQPRASSSPASPPAATTPSIVALGARVALVAARGAVYEVSRHTETETRLYVRDGAVTVRLLPGPARHVLSVGTDELWADATSTTYTVAVTAGRSSVAVHEGTVRVRGPGLALDVHAGETFSRGTVQRVAGVPEAARALAAWAAPADSAVPGTRPGADAREAPPARRSPAAIPPEQRWREARILEGRGAYESAAAVLRDLAHGPDTLWAPIALAELVSLRANRLGAADEALAAADEFLRRFPSHGLAAEVRRLACRAHRQRGDALPGHCAGSGDGD